MVIKGGFFCPSLQDRHAFTRGLPSLAAVIREQGHYGDQGPLVAIKDSGSLPPLYLVHPVGGDVVCYGELARHLDPEQPLYGLAASGLNGGESLDSVQAFVSCYIDAISEHLPEGPFRLGGWSLGGIIAMEMAQQFAERGRPPEDLVLIDTWLTICNRHYADLDIIMGFLRDRGRLSDEDLEWVFKNFKTETHQPIAFIEEIMTARDLMTPEFQEGRLEDMYRVFEACMKAVGAWTPRPFKGATTLYQETEFHQKNPEIERSGTGFKNLAMTPKIQDMGGNHYTMLSHPKNAANLASNLQNSQDRRRE